MNRKFANRFLQFSILLVLHQNTFAGLTPSGGENTQESVQTNPTSQAAETCKNSPEFRQFDFWIGEWNVESEGKQAGSSSIQLILDGCIIFENWTGTSGYSGKSFNLYNKRLRKWQQFWVDNAGGMIEFVGEFKDGQMRLEGESSTPEGNKVRERMTFFPLSADRVRQLWEQSRDNGKTWTVAFDGMYQRRK